MASTQHVHILMGSAGRCSWDTNPAVSSGAEGHWEALPASGLLLLDPLREPFPQLVHVLWVMPTEITCQAPADQGTQTTGEASMCCWLCVDSECSEFIGFVNSSGLPISRAQQSLGKVHRLAPPCPVFRLLFSGSNLRKKVHRYLQRPFIQTHTRGIFIQSSACCICYFEDKEGDRPKSVPDTKELKQRGATCFIYSPDTIAWCCSSSCHNICHQWALY